MLGERCDALTLDGRGVTGDRLFALRDRNGKLGSGKNTQRFHKIDGLFGFQAGYRDGVPFVRFPNGETLNADDASIHGALSAVLGQPVTLVKESEVPHFDDAPIHLLTSASLEWLRRTLPGAQADERRFRPNLVIDWPGDSPLEQAWIGKRLRIGDEVELRIRDATERCGMTAFAQADLPRDPSILRHVTRAAGVRFGVYAEVIVPGAVRIQDPVSLIDRR